MDGHLGLSALLPKHMPIDLAFYASAHARAQGTRFPSLRGNHNFRQVARIPVEVSQLETSSRLVGQTARESFTAVHHVKKRTQTTLSWSVEF